MTKICYLKTLYFFVIKNFFILKNKKLFLKIIIKQIICFLILVFSSSFLLFFKNQRQPLKLILNVKLYTWVVLWNFHKLYEKNKLRRIYGKEKRISLSILYKNMWNFFFPIPSTYKTKKVHLGYWFDILFVTHKVWNIDFMNI